jgi:hypothetical protein
MSRPPYTPPENTTIRYATRRHWYEIVEEVSQCVWWSTVIVLFTVGAAWIYTPLAWLLLIVLYPVGYLFAELLRWNCEWYIIIDYPNLKSRIVKVSGVFRKKAVVDDINVMGRTEESDLFDRIIGFRKVHLAFSNRIYLDGRRVPVAFLRELDKAHKKPVEDEDDDRRFVQGKLREWVQDGILDKATARIAATKWTMEKL